MNTGSKGCRFFEDPDLLQSVLDDTGHSLLRWNKDVDTIAHWGPSMDFFGVDNSVFPLKITQFVDLIHPDDREHVRSVFKNQAAPLPDYFEFRTNTKNKKPQWLRYRIQNTPEPPSDRIINCIGTDISAHKETELRLNYCISTLETSINASFASDMEGNVLFANKAAATMWGYDSVDEMIGEKPNVLNYWTAESIPVAEKILGILVSKGYYDSYDELVGVKKDGSRFSVRQNAGFTKDKLGNIIGVTGSFYDISDEKKFKNSLIEKERQYEDLVENLSSIILRIDEKGVVKYINKFGIDFFGFAKEEIEGRHVTETIVPRYDQNGKDLIEMVNSAFTFPEKFSQNDNENIKKDGDRAWISWANKAIYDSDGAFVEMLSAGNDITVLKKSENKIRESEEKFRSLVEGLDDGLVKISIPDGQYEYLSPSIETVFGHDPEKFTKNPDFLLTIAYDGHENLIKKMLEDARSGKVETMVEYAVFDSSKRIRWIKQSNKAIYDSLGNLTGMESLCRNVTDIRRSENALKEAEKIAKVGSWELDLINNILYWSDEIYVLLGIEKTNNPADYGVFLHYVHPDDREWVNKAYTDSVIHKSTYDIVHKMLLDDGSIKYVNEKGKTFYDDHGNPVRSIGTAADITEFKQTELELEKLKYNLEVKVIERTAELEATNEELQAAVEELNFVNNKLYEQEAMYRLLANNSVDVVCSYGPDMRCTYISPSIKELTGYTVDEALQQSLEEFIHPDDIEHVNEKIENSIAKKAPSSVIRYRRKMKNHDYVWVESATSFSYNNNGTLKTLIGNLRNISSQKVIEDELRESEERLRSVFENAGSGIVFGDNEGHIIFANEEFYRILGYDYHSGLKANIDIQGISDDKYEEIERQKVLEIVQGKSARYQMEKQFIRNDGSEIWVNWIVSVVRNNKGEIAYITGIAHDISEQKKAESAMEHALFELEVYNEKLKQTQSQLIINEKLASLGGLMAGIAHEINNPMNFIKGGVEALKEIVKDLAEEFKLQVEQTGLAEKEKSRTIQQVNMFNRLVGNIDNGVNRTLDIIKGLQVFTRSREDEIVKVDIHQNIDATLIVLNNIYKTIAVVEKHYGDIPLLECNPGKLNQVFSNLITNSSHAIQDKLAETNFSGKIVIRTKLTPDKIR